MEKTSKEYLAEKTFVRIPRKLGRKNPTYISTDNFDFAKLVDSIQNIGDQVGNVVQKVETVSGQINNVVSSVKNTTSKVKSVVNDVTSSANNISDAVKKAREVIKTKNTVSTPKEQPRQVEGSNSVLGQYSFGIPNKWILTVVAMIAVLIILTKLSKKS